jgi:hypothetical protein
MKALQLLILFSISVLSFTTCKRYSEGGWSNLAIKHLFGANQSRNIKNWKLTKYEVNGIDSTEYTNLYNSKIEFRIGNCRWKEYYVSFNSPLYSYSLEFSKNLYKHMEFKQSALAGTTLINQYFVTGFYRNVFNPPCSTNMFTWDVIKLTKSELIIQSNINGTNYKISLTS